MKIETHNPKFHPNDKVLFTNDMGNLILTTVDCCMFVSNQKRWRYYVVGFDISFSESRLSLMNIESREALKFTYEE